MDASTALGQCAALIAGNTVLWLSVGFLAGCVAMWLLARMLDR